MAEVSDGKQPSKENIQTTIFLQMEEICIFCNFGSDLSKLVNKYVISKRFASSKAFFIFEMERFINGSDKYR